VITTVYPGFCQEIGRDHEGPPPGARPGGMAVGAGVASAASGNVRRVPATAHAWHDRPALRRMGSPADPSSGALEGHCHDRNRGFGFSPCLAALVRT
jgi:hypothetical protein